MKNTFLSGWGKSIDFAGSDAWVRASLVQHCGDPLRDSRADSQQLDSAPTVSSRLLVGV